MKIQLPESVKWIISMIQKKGYEAYAVGGCVRDSLLGRIPDDWDITTSATPQQVKEIFSHTVDTGLAHGTITVIHNREGFEVTTYRIDGEYEDNRHPKEVTFTACLTEDLKRRDFTINAMAYNEEDGLVDAFGGIQDLSEKRIRCVGDAVSRFSEDALRVLRAVRFAAQLDFTIEEKTLAAMKQMSANLSTISAERIQTELVKLLVSEHPNLLMTAYECDITKVILPEFDRMLQTKQNNPHHRFDVGRHTMEAVCAVRADKVLRLTMLLHDVAKPEKESIDSDGISHFHGHAVLGERRAGEILRRLKFDNDTIFKVKKLIKWHDYRFQLNEKCVRKVVSGVGADMFLPLLEVMRADVTAQSCYLQQEKLSQLTEIERIFHDIMNKEQCISLKQLAVDGKDLMEAGIPSGKKLGAILRQLFLLVLDDPDRNDKEDLLKEAIRLYETGLFTE